MFEDIKEGDEVYILHPAWDRILKKVVSRTTNTQVIIDGDRYRKSNGNMVGGCIRSPCIRPKTPELGKRFEEYNTKMAFRRLASNLDEMRNYRKVTPEIVAKLQAIYDEVMSDE